MFRPIPEDESLPKREIDEAKAKIKEFLHTKVNEGELNIEDILAIDS